MSDRIDVLDASYDAVRIELEKTQQVIEYLERRAKKLRDAMEALDDVVNRKDDVIDGPSVTRIMDQLQQSAPADAEAGTAGEDASVGERQSSHPVPPWLPEGEGDKKKTASK